MKYSVEILRNAVADAIIAEDALQTHYLHKDYTDIQSWRYYLNGFDTEAKCKWQALSVICTLVGADEATAIAIEKAIRRNTMYHRNWESEPRMCSDHSYRRAVAATQGPGTF